MAFPFYRQHDAKDCGPACLRMIMKHYGKEISLQTLRDRSNIGREGVSMMGLSDAAEAFGMRTMGVSLPPAKLQEEAPLPCILHWKQNHFVVLYKIGRKGEFHIADPAQGHVKMNREEFLKGWISARAQNEDLGMALLLEPGPAFYEVEDEKPDHRQFSFLFRYLKPQRRLIIQLILGMVLGSLIQLILPFLTQSIVDKGIINQDLAFIYLVLIAQLVLIVSRTTVDLLRNWILLHLNTRINISLVSDFLVKLMNLPLGFFDNKLINDLIQRIGDQQRIQSFLTTTSLNILFGIFNILIFSIIIAIYSWKILLIFLVGSLVYFLWILRFLGRRRQLDYYRFRDQAVNQGVIFQILLGIQDIKLYGAERQKRWQWEQVQAKLFRTGVRSMYLTQYQVAGGLFFNETKNILISFLAAWSVLQGDMTLGMLVAIQYIIGQLNGPVDQMVWFIQAAQDARISLERMGEIHGMEDETQINASRVGIVPEHDGITVSNLTFRYEGPHSPAVLKDISLTIPRGKVTALVGQSGSGKTTLVKLLLGIYEPESGEIRVGKHALRSISTQSWRDYCGTVMQDSYIFWESVADNITLGKEEIDKERLVEAARLAVADDFIRELPMGYNTRIGQDGSGLSQGQKQRVLIARLAYKNPEYIFLDEATNALDSENEKDIMNNLHQHFESRTMVIVAHRLSTVMRADQIIVLDRGRIVERGTHQELTALKGKYYLLVKNQLELGN